MTDQATEQSGQDSAALTSNDLGALFAQANKPPVAEQPQGQAEATEGEKAQAKSGEIPEQSEQTNESTPVEKFKVPALEGDGFDELTAEEIKAQRLMHKDYTQKTQKLSEDRKAIEAERAKVSEMVNAKAQELENGLTYLGQTIQSFESQVDWEALRAQDPALYLQEREKQAQRVNAFKQVAQQLEQTRKQQQAQLQAVNAQRLVEAIPTWLDKQTAQRESQEIRQFAHEAYGMSDSDIDGIVDYRQILALRDAMKYRQAEKKVAEVKPKVMKAPELAKPGAPTQGNPNALNAHRATQNALKNPSVDALAAAFGAANKRK